MTRPCYCWRVCLYYACGCNWTSRTVHRCDIFGTNCNRWTTYRATGRDCIDCRDTDAWARLSAGKSKAERERVMDAEALGAVLEAEVLAEVAKAAKAEEATETEGKTESSVEESHGGGREGDYSLGDSSMTTTTTTTKRQSKPMQVHSYNDNSVNGTTSRNYSTGARRRAGELGEGSSAGWEWEGSGARRRV
ncbi:hypothetical protein VTJ49DRAFT_332 [Mycothermus thermophilus]|uniref:Uncharacterized protein n=1 Tax=Humicola insolens TaxID=85995 RepID=A0ABR3VGY4_HUMIN